ncbi:RNA-binding protein pop5 [Saxophila tyrrhenica]|uniref:Ribonuclease P/MRP protein subunit POP5 n=1 Tax=Saxophila tyrrhenica TaxID=1690608 RepID=A0AAV9P1P5_9PEZI|nr:RNA-binding protein pop5 [Saxophila tyrrhenica]
MVRVKHRYLLVNILYPDDNTSSGATTSKGQKDVPYAVQFHKPTSDRVDTRMFMQMIRNGVADLFGDYGSGMTAASLQVKYFSPATSTAIIRVARDHYRLVWAALTFTTQLPKPVNQPCSIQVVRVSGTIKKAEEEAIRRAQASIRRAQRSDSSKPLNSASGAPATPGEMLDSMGLDDDRFADGIEDADEGSDEDDSG